MAEVNDIPEIRFKGFSGEWEEKKLSDICSLITKGTTPLDKSGKGDINFIKVESIEASSGRITSTSKIKKEEHENYLRRSQLTDGDILFSIAGTLGRITTINRKHLPANTNQALAIIRLKEEKLEYVTTFLKGKAVDDYVKKNPTVGAQPNLSLEQVGNIIITLPDSVEQTQIGTFFKNLDNQITLKQHKLDKLVTLKKAMLEKMFPKEGADEPEIRLKGFSGAWEKKTLGEASEPLEYGLNAAAKKYDGVNKYLRITDIDDDSREFLKENLTSPNTNIENSKDYKLTGREILFARTGASVGKTYLYRESDGIVYFAGFLIKARVKSEYDDYFIFQNTLTAIYENFIQITSQRSGQPGVNANEYSSFVFKAPLYEEQKQIGSYFKNLDDLISLQKIELTKLKQIKSSCLEKMFV